MTIEILMPALSPTMTSGNLVKWFKKAGDSIKPGEVITEIETDKATMEVESIDAGTMGEICIAEGTQDVPVNAVLAILLEKGESVADIQKHRHAGGIQEVVLHTPEAPEPISQPSHVTTHGITHGITKAVASSDTHRTFITPLAKRVAELSGVDIKTITGTGPHGRIIKADVEGACAITPAEKPASTKEVSAPQSNPQGNYEDIPLTNMRKVIAKRLGEAKQTIPHFYLDADCSMESLIALRGEVNHHQEPDQRISINDFIIKALALALRDNPECNATWMSSGGDTYIRQYKTVDISVAVAVEGGLFTPIIRTAETKSLSTISIEMKSLVQKAKANKLRPEEFQGGAFSLSNLGMFFVDNFHAIVNPPQAGIMAVGGTSEKPVVKDGHVVPGKIMTCSLSVDHRIVDGAAAAKLLKSFKKYIESPLKILV